tara:strand:+ start:11060 stop:12967 length:1908 start_codon:yes stop_codon:yes gene_type:complete
MADNCNLDKKQTVDIKYLNKDFDGFRGDLIKYAKNYFPDVYNDFNESSPGMMFIEMSAYVGDVLSYYIDTQMKESLLVHAEERANVIDLAKAIGYTTKPTIPAIVNLSVYQVVPATVTGEPDTSYCMKISSGMEVAANSIIFMTQDTVDFGVDNKRSPRETTVYKVTNGAPDYFLLRKTVQAIAGDVKTEDVVFGDPKKFDKIKLASKKVITILDVKDEAGNKWYEVPYLAQDNIFEDVINNWASDPEMSAYNYDSPYILKLRRTSKRFTTHVHSDDTTELWFGAGISSQPDEVIVPNPDNIGMSLPYGNTAGNYMNGTAFVDISFDPTNTMFTRAYGLAPADVTLTVRYLEGGGKESNVPAQTIDTINDKQIWLDEDDLDVGEVSIVKGSLAVINLEPAVGGRSQETVDDIKQNALSHFASQNRAVTREDYIARIYAMPAKYGSVAKAYLDKDEQFWMQQVGTKEVKNPLAINLYSKTYDENKHLINMSELAKSNLQTYLSQYRMLTDAINIKNANVINIGISTSIIPRPGYQSKEVLLRVINKLRCIFDIDNWSIQEPIVMARIATELDMVEGVQSVKNINIFNLFDEAEGYSGNIYDIKGATKNGVIYPAMDPSIFELKNHDVNIKARIVGY